MRFNGRVGESIAVPGAFPSPMFGAEDAFEHVEEEIPRRSGHDRCSRPVRIHGVTPGRYVLGVDLFRTFSTCCPIRLWHFL